MRSYLLDLACLPAFVRRRGTACSTHQATRDAQRATGTITAAQQCNVQCTVDTTRQAARANAVRRVALVRPAHGPNRRCVGGSRASARTSCCAARTKRARTARTSSKHPAPSPRPSRAQPPPSRAVALACAPELRHRTPLRHAGGSGMGWAPQGSESRKPALSATVGGGHALWKARASAADGAEVTLALVVRAGRAPNDLKVQRRMGVHKLRVGPAPRTPTHTRSHTCAAHTHRHMPAGHCAVWDTTPHGTQCRMGYHTAWDRTRAVGGAARDADRSRLGCGGTKLHACARRPPGWTGARRCAPCSATSNVACSATSNGNMRRCPRQGMQQRWRHPNAHCAVDSTQSQR